MLAGRTRRNVLLACAGAVATAQQSDATMVTLILRPGGFSPSDLKLIRSVVTFRIISKTGQATIDYEIRRETGGAPVGALRADVARKGSHNAEDTVRLTPGKYILRAVGNPTAECRIEVAPR